MTRVHIISVAAAVALAACDTPVATKTLGPSLSTTPSASVSATTATLFRRMG